jgi:hypothetical protein
MAKSAGATARSGDSGTAPAPETDRASTATATARAPSVVVDPGTKRVQLQLSAAEYQLLEDVKRGMTTARNQTDTVLLSLKFVRWIQSLQQQGYKLAMVKDDRVEAVQVFM